MDDWICTRRKRIQGRRGHEGRDAVRERELFRETGMGVAAAVVQARQRRTRAVEVPCREDMP